VEQAALQMRIGRGLFVADRLSMISGSILCLSSSNGLPSLKNSVSLVVMASITFFSRLFEASILTF
jgi:hypothetical protein